MSAESENVHETPGEIKDLYSLVGSIASTWAHLEQSVDFTLWSLTGLEANVGASAPARIQASLRRPLKDRIQTLVALVEEYGGSMELVRSINQFATEAIDLTDARHRAVHDPVAEVDGEVVSITIRDRRIFNYRFSAERFQEYKKTNADIANILGLYSELASRIKAEIPFPPSPEM